MGKKIDRSFIVLAIGALVFFFPTSFSGIPLGAKEEIILWGCGLALIFLLALINGMDKKLLIVASAISFYMFLATYFVLWNNSYFRFSIARVAPLLCCLIILFTNIKLNEREQKKIRSFLNIVIYLIFLVNILLLIKIEPVKRFIISCFTQHDEIITAYQITSDKPISFFGVHNIASFFYTGLFIICMELYRQSKNKRYVWFMFGLFICNLLLKSTTSLGFTSLMILVILTYKPGVTKNKLYYFLVVVLGSIVFFASPLFSKYAVALLSKSNGFIPRYIDGFQNLYKNNFIELSRNMLGIGFTISDSAELPLYYTDSGYFIYLTMGNIILLGGIYLIFIKFIRKYTVGRSSMYILLLYLLFDLGGISFLFFRTIFFLVFTVYLIVPVSNKKEVIQSHGQGL